MLKNKVAPERLHIYNFAKYCIAKAGLPLLVSLKQLYQESRFNDKAVSKAGAKGVAQFMSGTFSEIYNKVISTGYYKKFVDDVPQNNPFDYRTSIILYCYYMAIEIPNLLKSKGYSDSWELRLRAYNAGIGNIKKSYYYAETNNYIKTILG